MGIFDRFSSLLKSNINDLISKAEDPEKMLTQILVDMRGQLVKAKQQVASAIADEKRLRDQADAEFKQAQDWERRAMLAIQEGRDDLAKQALVRQTEHTGHGEQLAGRPGSSTVRDGEAQELSSATSTTRSRRRSARRTSSSPASAAPRRSSASRRRCRLSPRRAPSRRSPGWRSASRTTSGDQGVVRDRRRVHRRHAAARVQAAREGRRRCVGRQSAARAQAEDGNASRARPRAEQGARRRSA